MGILIVQYILKGPFGNKYRFRVRMADDGSLSYRLLGYTSDTGFAISNMQLKEPLPAMRCDRLDDTLGEIEQARQTGLYQEISRQVFATVDDSNCCPHCGGEL